MDHTKDCKCKAYGYNNCELHRMLKDLRNGDPKKHFLRGPNFLIDKKIRVRINQYYLKNKDKKIKVSEDRLDRPPQRPTIPRVTQNWTKNLNQMQK